MKKSIISIAVLALSCTALLSACGQTATTQTTAAETTAASTAAEATAASSEAAATTAESTAATVEAVDKRKVYVGADWVKSVIDGEQEESADYVILEAAWGEIADDKDYTQGHIPGALHMNTDSVESEEFWNYRSAEEVEKLLKEYGITKDTTVITYGNTPEIAADDRVAVLLLWAGVENVKNLSGGLDAWKKAGYELETKINEPVATEKDFGTSIPAHPEYVLSIDEVKERLANEEGFRLVSIRSKKEFLGETSGYGYIDRAGEPLGAIWGHDTDDKSYNNADGTIVGLDTLNKYLAEYGASTDDNDLAFYCGTGWRACVPFLIGYENGLDNVYLYDGGWYQWQMDPENPVQLGEPGSADYQEVKVSDLSTDKAAK